MTNIQRISEKRYSLDVRGQVCPYPELLVLRALQSLSSNDILEIVLDNPPSVRDIPASLAKRGYQEINVSLISKGTWKIIVPIAKRQ
ncbi:MAG: sulfurtransferase TusA family protein [Candidatus Bathyarchaeota archaeon]|nr:MAG: sulfurtransferase TusA family protein [Candidatus Bathyarchaeota archaeon]